MVVDNVGVVYEAFTSPEIAVPPVAAVYQRYCPFAPPKTESVTLPVPHELALIGDVGATGKGFTVSVTVFEKTSGVKSPDTLQR